jgi:glycogen operon protein
VKLIAEPWDPGNAGYQLGQFPPGWGEWNDRYRDTLRRFWRGSGGQLPELASRLAGSSDIYDRRGRRPWASINFVTAHDGFTLHDLVSYNEKHNAANHEDNRDGIVDNYSWNCGVEGPTDDRGVLRLRMQQKRNLLTSLLLSQGVPMLLAGDEFGHTQQGNNNAYCQDNEISWLNWDTIDAGPGRDLLAFTRSLLRLRREHIVFHRNRFFHGRETPGTSTKDIVWLKPDGEEMQEADWSDDSARSLALLISGEAGQYHLTARGETEPDDSFMLILNASDETVAYVLPQIEDAGVHAVLIDTAKQQSQGAMPRRRVKSPYRSAPRSMVVISYRRRQG